MKLFRCDHCGHTLYFENVVCERCGHQLGYRWDSNSLVALEPDGDVLRPVKDPEKAYVYCANAEHGACNWLVQHNPGGDPFCRACRHNETVPNLADAHNLALWQTIERAKKRLMYSLLQLNLPLQTREEDPDHGLAFRFLNDAEAPEPVLTGHASGIVTLTLAEADDAERERRRTQFHEPYRTLLGHFRHEIGHHYWDLLIEGTPFHEQFRALFGDESADYGEALQTYYVGGAPEGWQIDFISAYATAHPWEDWAETFAHYLHLIDTVEMAVAFGVSLAPKVDGEGMLTADFDFSPYRARDIGELVDNWIPLSALINNLNRAVGQNDAYPFVLTPRVIEKLGFVQKVVASSRVG